MSDTTFNIVHTFRDRTGWDFSPDEPDHAEWTDAATGLACLAHRNRFGAWCGYVGVPKDHPLHGTDYDDDRLYETEAHDCHGGLTYSAPCEEGPEGEAVCHRSPEPAWWFGFDCAHGGDRLPRGFGLGVEWPGESYRDLAYVTDEVTRLAQALSENEDPR